MNTKDENRKKKANQELDCLFKVARGEMSIREMRKEMGDIT